MANNPKKFASVETLQAFLEKLKITFANLVHSHSFNDLEDKPFYEEYSTTSDTLTWDGNTEGLISVMDMFYLVSENVPTLEDFVNGCTLSYNENGVVESWAMTYEEISEYYTYYNAIVLGDAIIFIAPYDGFTVEDIPFPKAGIYFQRYFEEDEDTGETYLGHPNSLTIPNYGKFSGMVVNTLDEKFIPDAIARKGYYHEHEISDVNGLTESLASKASNSSLNNLQDFANDLLMRILNKAEQSDLNDLQSRVTNKADISDLNNLKSQISTKAEQSEVDKIKDGTIKVGQAQHADMSSSTYLDSNLNAIVDTYETKTDASSKLTEAKEYAFDCVDSLQADITSGAITAAYAGQSECDWDGNVITSTYETKADATSKLDEARGYTDTLQEKLENSDIWVGQAYFASEAEYDGQGFNIVDTYERKTDANSKLTEAKNYADKKVDDEYLFSNESTGDTIIWDGNTEGLVSTPDGSYYKVSDQAPTVDELTDGVIFDGQEYTLDNYDINEMQYGVSYIGYSADVVFVPESGANINISGMLFPEAGTYMSTDIYENHDLVLTVKNYTKYPIIKKVKKSLLPETELPDNLVEDADLSYFGASSKIVGKYNAVAYGNGKFVALPYRESSDSKFVYSTDGKNWIETPAPASAYWKDVVYAGGKFVAISSTSNGSGYHGAVSTDGVNWTATTLPSGGSPSQLACGNGRFVVVGSNQSTAWSTDGTTWNKVSFPSSGYPMGIAYGNGKFIVPTSSGKYFYSTNGGSWTEATMITANVSDILYDGTKFVIVGRNNAMYSADGSNWTQVSVPANANYTCLAYGGGVYVALGYASNTAIYSYDGINWIEANVDATDNWGDIAYGNGVFVAGTEDGSNLLTITVGNEYGLAYQKDVATSNNYTTTLSSTSWTDSGSGYYTQTVAITGILETDTPIVDIVLTLDANSNKAVISAWGNIQRITTSTDNITAYCFGNVPTIDIPIQLKVVR